MTLPKMKPCPKCGNTAVGLYGYGDSCPLNWHVECDDCHYLGPCGTQLYAVREHNDRANVCLIATASEIAELAPKDGVQ